MVSFILAIVSATEIVPFYKFFSGDMRSFWAYLRPRTLTFIRHIYDEPQHSSDQLEDCVKISLTGLKLREDKNKSQNSIVLFHSNGKNVYRDFKEFQLFCESPDEFHLWKDSISSCISKCDFVSTIFIAMFCNLKYNMIKYLTIVYLTEKEPDARKLKLSPFERDILDICKKVDTYMTIVKKTTRDMVPKAITLYIIRELEQFINNITADSNEKYVSISVLSSNLPEAISKHYYEYLLINYKLNHFPFLSFQLEMLGVGERDFTQYETMKKTYEACKEALNVIRMY